MLQTCSLDAADLLALARLDDDGAPPTVSSPQPADGQTSHAYRVARPGQPAASQAEATGPEHSPEDPPGGACRAGRRLALPPAHGPQGGRPRHRIKSASPGRWAAAGLPPSSSTSTPCRDSSICPPGSPPSPGQPSYCCLPSGHRADRPPYGTPMNTTTGRGPPGQPPAGGRCAMGTGTGIILITAGAV